MLIPQNTASTMKTQGDVESGKKEFQGPGN